VGPNNYIQTVNTAIGIYSKTGAQQAAFTYNTLFSGTGTPATISMAATGGSIRRRLRALDRDRLCWADINNGPFYECIAVSQTGDPVSGGWWFYGFLNHDTFFPDYPKLGIWPDGIYMSANLFDSFNTFQGVRVWAIDRNRLINGSALDNTVYFDLVRRLR